MLSFNHQNIGAVLFYKDIKILLVKPFDWSPVIDAPLKNFMSTGNSFIKKKNRTYATTIYTISLNWSNILSRNFNFMLSKRLFKTVIIASVLTFSVRFFLIIMTDFIFIIIRFRKYLVTSLILFMFFVIWTIREAKSIKKNLSEVGTRMLNSLISFFEISVRLYSSSIDLIYSYTLSIHPLILISLMIQICSSEGWKSHL